MKTLIYKELRENLKLAVPVFLLLTVICWLAALDGGDNALLGAESLRIFSLVCAGLGAALGWLQIHHERPRDLWAFLVHRPITRTEIFFAKIIVGLVICFATVSLPLLGYLIWISIPGHLSAPFEWGTALPAAGCVLSGLLWYFAAMLTSLREARWYASRGLGLAAALPLYAFALKLPGLLLFWQFELAIGLLTALLALAVWGSFQTDGYRGQPLPGKAALAAVTALGASVVVLVAIAFLANVLHRPESQTYYAVTKAGSVFRVVTRDNQPAVITDLKGTRLKDPKTGAVIELEELNRELPRQYHVSVNFGNPRTAAYNLQQPREFFYDGWREMDGIRWYWTRQGCLVGYEGRTHRFVGSVGPRGLVKDSLSSGEEFFRPGSGGHQILPRTLATSNSVYELDLRNRAAKPIFTALADDRIVGTRDVSDSATIIVTKQFVQMVDTEGKILCQFPHDPQYREPNSITVFPLEGRDQFVLWIYPSRLQGESLQRRFSRQMVRISGSEVGPGIELEPPNPPRPADGRIDEALSFFVSPVFPFIKPLLFRLALSHVSIQWKLVEIALVSAALCAVAGWLIGRRYRFGVQAQIGWALFHLLAGFPGLLAFLCVREWPARETCPACKKPRLVDRKRCDHCGADFSPPEKTGTEIFTPLNRGQTAESEMELAGADQRHGIPGIPEQ